MANGVQIVAPPVYADDEEPTTMDEQQDENQPDLQPSIQAPPVAAAPSTTIAPPGTMPVSAPATPALRSPEENQNRAMWRQLQRATADLPINQAEQAVTTALKFQGIRGYQKDLANGEDANKALAKWAPIMFTQPHAASLGQAASMVRATATPPSKLVDVGGVLYRSNPDGTVTALTPPKVTAPKTNPFDLQEHRALLGQIAALQKELDLDPSGPAADETRQKLQYLTQQAQAVRTRSSAPATQPQAAPVVAPGAPAPVRAAAPAPEVPPTVTTKAQFDALPSGAIYVGRNGHRYRKP